MPQLRPKKPGTSPIRRQDNVARQQEEIITTRRSSSTRQNAPHTKGPVRRSRRRKPTLCVTGRGFARQVLGGGTAESHATRRFNSAGARRTAVLNRTKSIKGPVRWQDFRKGAKIQKVFKTRLQARKKPGARGLRASNPRWRPLADLGKGIGNFDGGKKASLTTIPFQLEKGGRRVGAGGLSALPAVGQFHVGVQQTRWPKGEKVILPAEKRGD